MPRDFATTAANRRRRRGSPRRRTRTAAMSATPTAGLTPKSAAATAAAAKAKRLVVRISGAKKKGKVARLSRAQRSCRDQTSSQTPPAERLLERPVDEMGVQPLRPDELGRGGVFGDLRAQSFDASACFQHVPSPQHRLALREAVAGGFARILPARLIGVEEGAFDLGGEGLGPRADRRSADDAGVGAPARQQALDVVARHQHVGIGDDHPVVAGRLPSLDHLLSLGLALIRSSPTSSRAGRSGLAAIAPRTRGAIGSSPLARQKTIS